MMHTKRRTLTSYDIFAIATFYALGVFCIGAYLAYYLQLLPGRVPDNETARFMTFLVWNTVGLLGPCLLAFAIYVHLEWRFGWREKRKE